MAPFFSQIIGPPQNYTLLYSYDVNLIAYRDNDRSLFFVLIIFNVEDLLHGFLNEEQQPEQRMPHKTLEDAKENNKPEPVI